MITKADKKILFWDYSFVDKNETTAEVVMHKPVKRELSILHDEAWEGDCCGYHNIFKDGDIYRMYYIARKVGDEIRDLIIPSKICYAYSYDGIKWIKPDLKIREFDGMYENNIILGLDDDSFDNFYVLKDENPNTPDSERYKGIAVSYRGATSGDDVKLWCYVSPDGINFKKGWVMTEDGTFDSLNIVVWNKEEELYYCYYRGFHEISTGENYRDVRLMTSKDFKNWEFKGIIKYSSDRDYQMYTNGIFQYPDNPNYLVGLATRYVERKEWTPNYDELCGREKRKKIIEQFEPRSGLALTDCMLMTSNDGFNFHRFDEAFLTPGPEKKDGWVYGDCYPGVGLVDTASDEEGAANEYSLYMAEGHHGYRPKRLYRYSIRRDGFASMHAGIEEKKILTKEFEYTGGELYINFSTSAIGYVYVNILDENNNVIDGLKSCETFGDTVKRHVIFDKKIDLPVGKKIKLEIKMSDAEIYSFVFK